MKKHKLLREDILPAMATNRKVQRLLNEFMDLLSEYESAESNLEQKDLAPPPSTFGLASEKIDLNADKMDSIPPATDQMDTSKADTVTKDLASLKMDSTRPATVQIETTPPDAVPVDATQPMDQTNPTQPPTENKDPAVSATDEPNSLPPVTNQQTYEVNMTLSENEVVPDSCSDHDNAQPN